MRTHLEINTFPLFTVKQRQKIARFPRQYYLIHTDKLPLCFKDMSISQNGKKTHRHYGNPSISREKKKALKGKLKWHLWILLMVCLAKRNSLLNGSRSPSLTGPAHRRTDQVKVTLSLFHGLHPDARANCIICFRINS